MLTVIKKQIRVQWENWMACLAIILGGWLVGGVLFRVISGFLAEETKEYIPIGTVMGAALAVIFLGFIGMMSLELYFNLEISMGCTRGRFFCIVLSHLSDYKSDGSRPCCAYCYSRKSDWLMAVS